MGVAGRPELPLAALQPSQLYICQAKFEGVQAWFAPAPGPGRGQRFDPVPVRRLGKDLVLTDGHTRALAAHLAGWRAVPAVWDEDDLDWQAYRICVRWCKAEGIRRVGDLATRIVSAEDYQRLWLDRCRALHEARAWSG